MNHGQFLHSGLVSSNNLPSELLSLFLFLFVQTFVQDKSLLRFSLFQQDQTSSKKHLWIIHNEPDLLSNLTFATSQCSVIGH